MAFTFQINTDVEFIHDENLLKKPKKTDRKSGQKKSLLSALRKSFRTAAG